MNDEGISACQQSFKQPLKVHPYFKMLGVTLLPFFVLCIQITCYSVVEYFNNREELMATINFSVPDEVKQAFNNEFAKENKSAILTRLMERAIEENRIKKRRHNAIDAILALREQQTAVLLDEISNARKELR
jgi:hypothetical protein